MSQDMKEPDRMSAESTTRPCAHVHLRATGAIANLYRSPDQRFGASSVTAAGSSATWTAPAFSSR
jgi:hypothetical protein